MPPRRWPLRLATVVLTSSLTVGAVGGGAGAIAGPSEFQASAKAKPKKAFFDGEREAGLRYEFSGPALTDVEVEVVRRGHVLMSWIEPARQPSVRYALSWDGITDEGRVGPDGGYKFRVSEVGGEGGTDADRFHLYGHKFPVRGPHGTRGGIGDFGAPRTGGRRHEGFDIVADCGTRLVAARGGTVQRKGLQRRLKGQYLVIDGRRTKADYVYAHLKGPAEVGDDDRVLTGQRIGRVGKTGNARSTPCHLHVEIWPRGWHKDTPANPETRLREWDGWS